jgi:hypothetical protein
MGLNIFRRHTERTLVWQDRDKEIFDEDYKRTYTLFSGLFNWVNSFNLRNDLSNLGDNSKMGFRKYGK